ncbi:hypothetical protein MKJ04_17325 [Pontibacter sp. E15-1]|uniref:hypothetical protein n=1 Tax=Pontibacter sp. E15-1 TaxID=2919918 RepID=UPI001F4F3EBA|nr:hypothetical protein [Pontibacter sp. E15-1]MCJ8166610.1 hypothetical protein [Pontibacter sp. E15-1]
MLQVYVAFFRPEIYQNFAEYSLIPIYKTFILEWMPRHTPEFILAVATLQLWVGLSIWGKGWFFKGGVLAGIVLLVLLLPLGLGGAFPATLNMALGLRILMKREAGSYLWPVISKEYSKTKSYAMR